MVEEALVGPGVVKTQRAGRNDLGLLRSRRLRGGSGVRRALLFEGSCDGDPLGGRFNSSGRIRRREQGGLRIFSIRGAQHGPRGKEGIPGVRPGIGGRGGGGHDCFCGQGHGDRGAEKNS